MGGVCGVYSSNENCIFDLLKVTQRLQHLGQEWSGIAISTGKTINHIVRPKTVREGFPINEISYKIDGDYTPLENLQGNVGIGCTSVSEKQPMCLSSSFGRYAVAFDGRLLNTLELKQDLMRSGSAFYRENETEIITKLIGAGKNIVDGIKLMNKKIKGSFSIVVLHNNCIYAARDPYAVNPLQFGRSGNKLIVASETEAIWRGGVNFVRDIKPGEIVQLSKDGMKTVGQMDSKRTAYCAFRWFYTGRVDAVLQGVSSDEVRKRAGEWHAKKDKEEGVKVDFVAGMPMSGTSYAIGYSKVSDVPYDEAFLYDRYSARSYIPPTQEERDRIADEKVTVMKHTIKCKRFVITDDSIVRGTVLKYKIQALKKAGAKEIHVRIGFPPLIDKCLLNVSTKRKDELAVYKFGNIEAIRKHIGADSLRYTPFDVAVECITNGTNLSKEDLCLFCINSENPLE